MDTTPVEKYRLTVESYHRMGERHGIAEAWLIDLLEKRLELYHGPKAGEYGHVDCKKNYLK